MPNCASGQVAVACTDRTHSNSSARYVCAPSSTDSKGVYFEHQRWRR